MNADNVDAERMSSGRLLEATGPATQNARLPSCSLVLGSNKGNAGSGTESRKVGTVKTGMHSSLR